MKKTILYVVAIIVLLFALQTAAFADGSDSTSAAQETVAVEKDNSVAVKAIAAAAIIGVGSAVGAIAMSMSISKSAEGISRQPEAASNIRSQLMLGLVFIETAIIYALIVAILIIFVL